MVSAVSTEQIQARATEALEHFRLIDRDKDTIFATKEGAPGWVRDIVSAGHGEMFPDDLRYEYIHDALYILANCDDEDNYHESIDADVDVYTHDLTGWLHSRIDRFNYVDEATEELGQPDSIITALQYGQYREREEVLYLVKEEIEEQLADIEEDEEV